MQCACTSRGPDIQSSQILPCPSRPGSGPDHPFDLGLQFFHMNIQSDGGESQWGGSVAEQGKAGLPCKSHFSHISIYFFDPQNTHPWLWVPVWVPCPGVSTADSSQPVAGTGGPPPLITNDAEELVLFSFILYMWKLRHTCPRPHRMD